VKLVENVPLAPLCTLGVGGPARLFLEAPGEDAVLEAAAWAARRDIELRVLGGGSNLVIADRGVDGLVVRIAIRSVSERPVAGGVEITAGAGEPWDDLVRRAVARGQSGLECLSGIPGLVGATPIQNVGAYGQEVSDTVVAVRALDRVERAVVTLGPAECRFGYRDSVFRSRAPGRYVVLAVTYRLVPGGAPTIRYAEVAQYLEVHGLSSPSLADVRTAVLAIRRAKSMVIEAGDPNRRSCGSFFINPVVGPGEAESVHTRAGGGSPMPSWPQPDGRVKLSAAWLLERAGFARGYRQGAVGLSSRHSLAIVAHDGARAWDVVALARQMRARVEDHFGIRLVPEPAFWGLALG
jgi:UDP-N-acetylmuramate dehydrogenase